MEDQLWSLFRETGDPMGYLLYKAKDQKPPEEAPPRRKREERERSGAAASL